MCLWRRMPSRSKLQQENQYQPSLDGGRLLVIPWSWRLDAHLAESSDI